MNSSILFSQKNEGLYARQIAFCAAFILPVGKFLETPSLLAGAAKDDVLIPAVLQFLTQSLVLLGVLYASSKSEKPLLTRLQKVLGKWSIVVYAFFALFYLFVAILPLLDLEKFVYAAFFDTAPTTFSFAFFFFLLAFVCAKGLKSIGRCADLCLFLFLLPFLALIGMSFFEADLSRLLPFFGTSFKGSALGFLKGTPHFCDAILLLPLIANRKYKEGDGVKIMSGYWAGCIMCLLFFAVFFGVFSSLAPREHYAFLKIAQYFPALDVVGRVDLLFVYFLSIVLLFYTCLPLIYVNELTCKMFHVKQKAFSSAILALISFIFVLFMNKYYNAFYAVVGGILVPVFLLVSYLLPLFCLLMPTKKEKTYAK